MDAKETRNLTVGVIALELERRNKISRQHFTNSKERNYS